MLSPTAKEQQILDSIENLSATGKLTRKREVSVHDNNNNNRIDPDAPRNSGEDSFQALVNDLVAKPAGARRRSSARDGSSEDPRKRAGALERANSLKKRTSSLRFAEDEDENDNYNKSRTSDVASNGGFYNEFNSSSTAHQQQQHLAPFENLVTQYEAASNNLPANLAARFQDATAPGAQQLALQVEQWVSAEGLNAGGGGANNHRSPGGRNQQQQRRSSTSSQQQQQQQDELLIDDSNNKSSLMLKNILGSSTVGLSNAAKSRLRNLLEQGLNDFVQRLQTSTIAEIEGVNIASAQVVARGGVLSHQYESLQQELAVAKKEIVRIREAAETQDQEMKQLQEESKLRDDQFDLVRQQLSSREEMLRESTSTFRKELNRFRSRISDLEAELERKQFNTKDSHHNYGSSSSSYPAGAIRPGMISSSSSPRNYHHRHHTVSSTVVDPDPSGVIAAAAQMDTIRSPLSGQHNSNASGGDLSSQNDLSTFGDNNRINNNNEQQQDYSPSNNNNNNTNNNISPIPTHHNHNQHQQSASPGGISVSGFSSAARNVFSANDPSNSLNSPTRTLSVPQIIQLASDVGMEEAVNEMRKEFEEKLFRARERFMFEKKDSLAKLRSKQEFTLQKLKRDVEERDRKLKGLKERYGFEDEINKNADDEAGRSQQQEKMEDHQ